MMGSEDGEFLADLECGGSTSEDEGSRDPVSGTNRGKKSLSRGRSGAIYYYNGSVGGESDTDSSDSFTKSSDIGGRRVEVLIERSSGGEECRDLVALLDKRKPSDQRKKPGSKKPSKPPRPPKGPLLNAADLKLVRELSELAARKRARVERMKALRKMKEAKRAYSGSSIPAMVITILFFLVIIFQGVFSRNNVVSRESLGSPAPAISNEGLISIQFFNNAPTNSVNGPVSASLKSLERPPDSSPQEQGKDTG